MAQYDGRSSGTGRSRARGSSRAGSRSASAAGGRNRNSSGSGTGRSNYTRSSSGKRRSTGGRRGGSGSDFGKIALGGIVLIIAIACIVFLMKGMSGEKTPAESETEMTTVPETELQKEVLVEGINITGMSREDAKTAILDKFSWGMTVQWEDKTYEVANLMSSRVDALLEEIYTGEPKENYTLDTSGMEDAVTTEAANAAAQWDKKPKNGSISGYDASSNKFTFSDAETGYAVDQERLKNDMLAALESRNFSAQLKAEVSAVAPEITRETAQEKYKTISSVTTKTTSNAKRNTNVRLSCEAINGIVLQPGEEFSFNQRVGQRTEAKGYKGAAAYNNGEVVEEIGGGVCQTSSTLYNAVLKAGLKTTVRRSHTFEPSYVTPGTDATVSWGGPDYAFVNNSSTAIGIRASYSNQECTVSIYGIPILEEGVTYSLQSTKLKDIDPPGPTYQEDGTLQPGEEKIKSSGSKGSYWETRLVIKKNGEVISQEVDHTTTYKGHAPVILRNTSGTMAPGAETTVAPAETIVPDPNANGGAAPEESSSAAEGPAGPSGSGSPGAGNGAGESSSVTSGVVSRPGENPTVLQPESQAPTSAPTGVPSPAPGHSSDTPVPQGPGGSDGAHMVVPPPGN